MYVINHENGEEVFLTFDELKSVCEDIFNYPDDLVEDCTGKMNYDQDPTYNLRRKNVRTNKG